MQNLHILLSNLALISLVLTEGTTLSPRRGLAYSSCSSNFPGPFQISLVLSTPPTPTATPPAPTTPTSATLTVQATGNTAPGSVTINLGCKGPEGLCIGTVLYTTTTRGKVVAGPLGKHGNKWLGHSHLRGSENSVAGVH
ncbi:hypothetical protein BGX38DRAFT_1239266 [Terfezia claveryi]|nr:hypothetical protein BGX38DRAFT_1239266 [Terfezia claveryi]